METVMLNVFANSLMIATRTPGIDATPEFPRLTDSHESRTRRRREIAAFIALARSDAYRQLNP
jgi:hypothetical protein